MTSDDVTVKITVNLYDFHQTVWCRTLTHVEMVRNVWKRVFFCLMIQFDSELRFYAMILGFCQGVGHEPKQVIHQHTGLGERWGISMHHLGSHFGMNCAILISNKQFFLTTFVILRVLHVLRNRSGVRKVAQHLSGQPGYDGKHHTQ